MLHLLWGQYFQLYSLHRLYFAHNLSHVLLNMYKA